MGTKYLFQGILILFIGLQTPSVDANICSNYLNIPQNQTSISSGDESNYTSLKPIESLDDFYEAMTKNLALKRGHKDLYELYRASKFGNSGYSVNGRTLVTALDILNKHPDLEKPLFREQILSRTVKVYETPDELMTFIRSQIQGFGTFKSNFLHIDANHKFWRKLLGLEYFTDERFQRRLNRIFSEDLKTKLKNTNSDNYIENLTLIVKQLQSFTSRLEQVNMLLQYNISERSENLNQNETLISENTSQLSFNKNTIHRINQTLIDIIHISPFFNSHLLAQLKSAENALDKIEAFRQMLSERDLLIIHLKNQNLIEIKNGQDGHFHEILENLNLKDSTYLNTRHGIEALLQEFENLTKAKDFNLKNEDQIRIRPLSIIEAPFRGCLGGTDCSTRTYFDKALDPNFIYFTMTDSDYNSSGHITLVLGTAKDKNNNEEKVAFVDKIQNVPNDKIAIFLEGVRRSLEENGYTLVIPKDVGDHNGLSNESTTRDFVKSQLLINYQESVYNFTPHKHEYIFENEHSRAYGNLEAFKVNKLDMDQNLAINAGEIYKPKLAPEDLSIESLIAPIMDLKNSNEDADILQYLAFADSAESLAKYGFDIEGYWQGIDNIFNTTQSDFVKKQTLYKLLINKSDRDHLLIKENFSPELWSQLIGELPQWKSSSNQKRKEVWNRISSVDLNLFVWSPQSISLYYQNPFKDINWKDQYNHTALMHAAVYGHSEAVPELLKQVEIDVNAKTSSGRTALMIAAESNYPKPDIVKELLGHPKIDVNAKDDTSNGDTALLLAIIKHQSEIVELLLKHHNTDVNARNKFLKNAFLTAVSSGNNKLIQMILNHPDFKNINRTDSNGRNWLMLAAEKGNTQLIHDLIYKSGVDVNSKEAMGKTAFMYAIEANQIGAAFKILKHPNIDLNIISSEGFTALMLASKNGRLAIVKELLHQPNIDINTAHPGGTTAFMFAASDGHIEVLREFLKIHPNIDLNTQNNNYFTALMLAAHYGHFEIIQELLKQPNISVNEEGFRGTTALRCAKNQDIRDLLISAGAIE